MHLYIHVPFCARRCSYCDFAIAVRKAVPSSEYQQVLLQEWALRQKHPGWEASPGVATVYFGGGTPSLLAPAALDAILGAIHRDRAVDADAEITLEANPDDVTAESAEDWRALGITRVSLGSQSFDDAVLTWMHRTHSAAQVPAAVDLLRIAGISNVSLDLIFALPEHLDRNWDDDLARAMALEPAHLSLYGLTFEPHTALDRWRLRGEASPPPDERYAEEYLAAVEAFARHGFEHYEVSNAARPGFRSRHNSAYWERRPFLGLGPAAHGSVGRRREWNEREWEAYRRRVMAGEDPIAGGEDLDDDALALEERYLGLRTGSGAPEALIGPVAERWIREGWARKRDGRIVLTPEGWLRLDALALSS